MLPRDSVIEVNDMRLLPEQFDKKISSVRIEGWTSSTDYSQSVFMDEFDQMGMDDAWEWEDPRGHGQWTEHQGYLQMNVDSGVDLWHGANYDAPRLIQPIQGNFTIETRMPVTSQLREHGGLLVWKGPWAFLRLEKTSGAHPFRGDVRFERHFSGGYRLIGRGAGLQRTKHLYLRLERDGNRFRGFASGDGVKWMSTGETISGMTGTVMVGLHALCPGNIPPTSTRFDYFAIYRRPSEAHYHFERSRRPPLGTQPPAPVDDGAAADRPFRTRHKRRLCVGREAGGHAARRLYAGAFRGGVRQACRKLDAVRFAQHRRQVGAGGFC